jgi:hypothetical protein
VRSLLGDGMFSVSLGLKILLLALHLIQQRLISLIMTR